MQLRSSVAVAVAVAEASGCSSDLTPSLGTSMCCRYGNKKKKNTVEYTHILLLFFFFFVFFGLHPQHMEGPRRGGQLEL